MLLTFEDDAPLYPGFGLTDDTSICLGNTSSIHVEILQPGDSITCNWQGLPLTVRGIDPFGHTFYINLGGGNDYLAAMGYPAGLLVCGGSGKDLIETGSGYQYIAGGAGNDFMDGGPDYDNVRGGSENDILYRYAGEGADKLRGEDQKDCMSVVLTSPLEAGSSCGASSSDMYLQGHLQPDSCEDPVQTCPFFEWLSE
jgi:hypothetical protein